MASVDPNTPQLALLEAISATIWVIFVIPFVIELVLAPRKLAYLRSQWLTVLSLALPPLRVLRIALGASMGRRSLAYVAALTFLVIVAGAAGMLALEREASGGLPDYAPSAADVAGLRLEIAALREELRARRL